MGGSGRRVVHEHFLASLMCRMSGLRLALNDLWLGVREWCGDSAYDRYVEAQQKASSKNRLLTPAEFYVERLNNRYSRPNRCC
jgi:uncharacterized short protein YbdD (DUF466 family)